MPDDLLAAASKFYWNKDRPHIDIPTVMADFARTAIASAVKSERSLENVLAEWYAAERNVSISSFWDGGWTVKIGDETNGFTETARFDHLQDVAEFLQDQLRGENNGQ